MKKIIPFLALFVLAFFSCKTEKVSKKLSEEKIEKQLVFPDDFFGIYKGKLQIENAKGSQEIDMEYHLLKTDSVNKFDYKLVYNGQPRNYTLIKKENETYEVDENNGIILPTYVNKNTLHSFFEVQGNLLSTRAAFSEDSMDFEILFTRLKNKIKTGGISKEIPEVFGYPITTFQKAVLVKI